MSIRRGLLMAALAAGMLLAAPGGVRAQDAASAGALTTHTLPELPYAYDALEPHIDAKTMELHHSKHHAAYVKGLNEAEAALAKARAANDYAMVQYWSKRAAFNGGGHFLHSMFWTVMAPAGKGGG
ncbi:MAG TPA: superoxide dismutase, partial [Candidatus Hydrogenedentes bacterium]|nr:superoxide dismutase [Candidatus Hydrogenedentota bacterium]